MSPMLAPDNARRFEGFLKEVRPLIVGFTYRICGDNEDAEDIVQNTLVEAFLIFSGDSRMETTRLWMLELAYRELNQAVSARRPWQMRDDNLVLPVATDEQFWERIAGEAVPGRATVPQRESFHIGFLTILQRLPFKDRVVFVGSDVLGLTADELSEVMKLSVEDVRFALERARTLMSKHYYTRDPARTLWRTETVEDEALKKFINVLNRGEQNSFRHAIDANFLCLLTPAPGFQEEIFFNDFLSEAPACRLLRFQINGQPVFTFEDDDEIHALAVAVVSAKGVASILGYDIELLSPRIRNLLEENSLQE